MEGSINIEKAIMKTADGSVFYDEPEAEDGFDYEGLHVVGILPAYSDVGGHKCIKSALYDDMEGYVDEVQDEESMPDGKYVVTYFACEKPGMNQLLQLADVGISKAEIIANVKAQKYIEGADYYPMAAMIPVDGEEHPVVLTGIRWEADEAAAGVLPDTAAALSREAGKGAVEKLQDAYQHKIVGYGKAMNAYLFWQENVMDERLAGMDAGIINEEYEKWLEKELP